MNMPDEHTRDSSADFGIAPALFDTDTGAMALDTRMAYCKLMTGPCIDPDSPLWPALLRDEAQVRSRLSELFLDLIMDRERRVAFTRQADTGELDTPILLRSLPLNYLDSVLILHLRQLLVDADFRNERAIVDESELIDYLEIYAPSGGDQVGARKRIVASIERMKKNTILQGIRGVESRYEISPTLRLLFTADDVQAMTDLYKARLEDSPSEADRHE